ncbi:hypothetical protein SVAN01_11713 [Stagonosporopsis vannaccii]|nr:hypothetical protein SVAN01_11713 [Stagonosporopsis vannaccii]
MMESRPQIGTNILSDGDLFQMMEDYSREDPNAWAHIPAACLREAPVDIELPRYASYDLETFTDFFKRKRYAEGSQKARELYQYYPFNLTTKGVIKDPPSKTLNGCAWRDLEENGLDDNNTTLASSSYTQVPGTGISEAMAYGARAIEFFKASQNKSDTEGTIGDSAEREEMYMQSGHQGPLSGDLFDDHEPKRQRTIFDNYQERLKSKEDALKQLQEDKLKLEALAASRGSEVTRLTYDLHTLQNSYASVTESLQDDKEELEHKVDELKSSKDLKQQEHNKELQRLRNDKDELYGQVRSLKDSILALKVRFNAFKNHQESEISKLRQKLENAKLEHRSDEIIIKRLREDLAKVQQQHKSATT